MTALAVLILAAFVIATVAIHRDMFRKGHQPARKPVRLDSQDRRNGGAVADRLTDDEREWDRQLTSHTSQPYDQDADGS